MFLDEATCWICLTFEFVGKFVDLKLENKFNYGMAVLASDWGYYNIFGYKMNVSIRLYTSNVCNKA